MITNGKTHVDTYYFCHIMPSSFVWQFAKNVDIYLHTSDATPKKSVDQITRFVEILSATCCSFQLDWTRHATCHNNDCDIGIDLRKFISLHFPKEERVTDHILYQFTNPISCKDRWKVTGFCARHFSVNQHSAGGGFVFAAAMITDGWRAYLAGGCPWNWPTAATLRVWRTNHSTTPQHTASISNAIIQITSISGDLLSDGRKVTKHLKTRKIHNLRRRRCARQFFSRQTLRRTNRIFWCICNYDLTTPFIQSVAPSAAARL